MHRYCYTFFIKINTGKPTHILHLVSNRWTDLSKFSIPNITETVPCLRPGVTSNRLDTDRVRFGRKSCIRLGKAVWLDVTPALDVMPGEVAKQLKGNYFRDNLDRNKRVNYRTVRYTSFFIKLYTLNTRFNLTVRS